MLCVCAYGQAQILDDFSDGDLSQNPSWFGTLNHFEIDDNYWLHLNAPSEDAASFICIENVLLENATWQLDLILDFNPSGSNYMDWYFMANDSNLLSANKAYFVRVGGTDDDISLFVQEEGVQTLLIDGLDGSVSLSEVVVTLKVTREAGGLFKLWYKTPSTDWFYAGSTTNNQCIQALYSGVLCKYTSSRSDKFYFDNYYIEGESIIDSVPPKLNNALINTPKSVLLYFENDDFGQIPITTFAVYPTEEFPLNIEQNGTQLLLNYENDLPVNSSFWLALSMISDTAGNIMEDTIVNLYQQNHVQFDVIINELMIDPEPAVQLPNAEYIELYNRANYPINMDQWSIQINNNVYKINDATIGPQNYMLLLKPEDTLYFSNLNSTTITYGNLNNTSAFITISDSNSNIIHQLAYTTDWYKDENKKDGGWSLELINPNQMCLSEQNWRACENITGGSPGFVNSVFSNYNIQNDLFIESIQIINSNSVAIKWSELIYSDLLINKSNYQFNNNLSIDSIHHSFSETIIYFINDIVENILYEFTIDSVYNCNGDYHYQEQSFIKGVWPEPGSLLINELLFNPEKDGYDYVELYNNSDDYLELSEIMLGNYDSLTKTSINGRPLSHNFLALEPHSFICISEDINWVKETYLSQDDKCYLEVETLGSYPNTEGSVCITNLGLEILDYFTYEESMHFNLLESYKGVSLERLSFIDTLWFSASSKTNYGSPATHNSQASYQYSTKEIEIIPELISPNLDGRADFAEISLSTQKATYIHLKIIDSKGSVVWSKSNHEFVKESATWIWDGLDNNGQPLSMGIYMLLAECIAENGETEYLRHPITIFYD